MPRGGWKKRKKILVGMMIVMDEYLALPQPGDSVVKKLIKKGGDKRSATPTRPRVLCIYMI